MTNPASTGGSGPHFEAEVGAAYLLSMLLELDARGLPGCQIESIQLQRGQEGYPLDDVIIHGRDRTGNAATMEIQVKRTITFAPSDKVFREVLEQVKDASGKSGFWATNHQLAVALARTSQKIDAAYQDVLSWARNMEDAASFYARLKQPGKASEPMRSFVSTFRENLKVAGGPNDDETVWKLLRRFQILAFDFTATGSASLELMNERALRALDGGSLDEARNLWSRLVSLSLEIAEHGGHRDRESLLRDLATFRLAASHNNRKALAAIAEESRLALSDINDSVSGVHLMRQLRVDIVREAMSRSRYIEIRGEAGVGKSGILRRLAEDLSAEAEALVLSPNRVVERGWLSLRAAAGYDGSGRNLMNDLSLSGAAIVFIDNLDFFAPEEQTIVKDLVRFASEVPNIWVIITARLEFPQSEPNWLPKEALTRLGQTDAVLIEELDEEEVTELRQGAQRLSLLLSDSHPARSIVRNLYRLSRLANRKEDEIWPATEAEMAKQWWDLADGAGGAGLRERARILRRLAEHSLSSRQPYNAEPEDAEALNHLVASGSLRDYGNDRVTFRHDVLREWATANLVFAERGFGPAFQLGERATPDMARGAELAARMALEMPDGVQRWQEILTSLSDAHESWRRAVLLALVRSELSIKILATVGPVLLENDAMLFKDLARYVIAVEFESAGERMRARGLKLEGIPSSWQVPRNISCAHLVGWLLLVSANLPPSAIPDAVKVYSAYLIGTLGNDVFAPLILQYLYQWLQAIEIDRESNPYGFTNRVFAGAVPGHQLEVMEAELRTAFVSFCHRAPELASSYLESFRDRQHADETRISILQFRGTLAQAAPKQLVDFTIDTLIGDGEQKERRHSRPRPERPFEFIDLKFLPASPSQGPFLDLLLHSPEEGVRLVRRILTYAVQFYRGDKSDDHAIVVYFNEDGTSFPWREFYYWSRDNGNAPSLVTSALMALEAWAHKRVEEGDQAESVVAQIVGDPAMSTAALLVAVDVVLSHGPQAIAAAIPLVACPELLCLDRLRPVHDNLKLPDFLGLKGLQQEPMGRATLDSLSQRNSRKMSLYDVLCRLPFGPPDVHEKVRALVLRAVDRLGPPGEKSDLRDPRLMALHALNVLNRDNWKEVNFADSEGQEQTALQYQSPEAERKQLEPIQRKTSPRLEESNLRLEILNSLYAKQAPTPEFLARAISWAERHMLIFDNRPEFDWNGEYLANVEAVVSAATLVARYGTDEQLTEYDAWMRGIFVRTHEGDSDAVYLMREGLRFNPRAVAFVGQTLLIQRDPRDQDTRQLLYFACVDGYASAHGFGVALGTLEQINPLLIPSVLRCAFDASVKSDLPGGLAEEEKNKHKAADQERVQKRIDCELAWLGAPNCEPPWPEFPIRKVRSRDHGRHVERDYAREAAEYHSVKLRVDYHRAALWLKQARPIFDPNSEPWLRPLVSAYREWTLHANGFGEEKVEQYDGQPDEWNEVYFELAAKCVSGLNEDTLSESLQTLFAGLPDESFCDTLPLFLRSADQAFFETNLVSTGQLLQIRAFLVAQLSETKVFGQNRDRDEARAETHLARALGPICFNDFNSPFPSKCYLPSSFIPRTDPFLLFTRSRKVSSAALIAVSLMGSVPGGNNGAMVASRVLSHPVQSIPCKSSWLSAFRRACRSVLATVKSATVPRKSSWSLPQEVDVGAPEAAEYFAKAVKMATSCRCRKVFSLAICAFRLRLSVAPVP